MCVCVCIEVMVALKSFGLWVAVTKTSLALSNHISGFMGVIDSVVNSIKWTVEIIVFKY